MCVTNPSLAIWPIWANYGFGGWIPISSSLSDVSGSLPLRPPARPRLSSLRWTCHRSISLARDPHSLAQSKRHFSSRFGIRPPMNTAVFCAPNIAIRNFCLQTNKRRWSIFSNFNYPGNNTSLGHRDSCWCAGSMVLFPDEGLNLS